MNFPDQSSLNMVRDALWRRSAAGASVMVGSGFSRNAIPTRLNPTPLPMWADIGRELNTVLNRSGVGDKASPTSDGVPRIAQEYEAVFGRTALNLALQRLVPNLEYKPGEEHARLLRLDWDGVYTTNWDTLLERTSPIVLGRAYDVVCNVNQIPMATRPRIVKLHGSFPAQFPLIVTEEDYRTYPDEFAPFVNIVQQALMETVFLLVGFSGDDPNFLRWAGWVRDNLGASAPKIYLAGYLRLSPHRRRMLEDLNVAPIDLALHPKAHSWVPTMAHHHAMQWLLLGLELGRTYEATSWPAVPTDSLAVPDTIAPVEEVSSERPWAESDGPESEEAVSADSIRELTLVWEHNRQIYPGWLTLPSSKRWELSDTWSGRILTHLTSLTTTECLYAIRESVWREEILLEPMSSDFETTIDDVLARFDCEAGTIDGVQDSGADWTRIREAWRHCGAALVTAARFRSDRKIFENRVERLKPFFDEDPDIRHRVQYERCLWALSDLDFEALAVLLVEWETVDCDPVWWMRKSAVMREVGHLGEAEELLLDAISSVRSMPPDRASVAGPSREAWASFAVLTRENHREYERRMRELSLLLCSPNLEREAALEGLVRSRRKENPPDFDPDEETFSWRITSGFPRRNASYRAIRLAEVVGLPPFANRDQGVLVWADVMREVATAMAEWDLPMAVRLALRSSGHGLDRTLERVLTRPRLATLTSEQAQILAGYCLCAIDGSLPLVISKNEHAARTNVYIEALSRLAVRVGPELAESILDRAIAYSRDSRLYHTHWGRQFRNLLRRAWATMLADRRRIRAMDLFATPIIGLNQEIPPLETRWPDPAGDVRFKTADLPRRVDDPERWQEVVDLIVRGLAGDITPRRRASRRLAHLVRTGDLDEEETRRIGEALWSRGHLADDGLPGNTDLHDWAFIVFPEPEVGISEERFRAKWLPTDQDIAIGATTQEDDHKGFVEVPMGSNPQPVVGRLDDRLWQVGNAIHQLRIIEREFHLSCQDLELLTDLLEQWADASTPNLPDPNLQRFYMEPTRRALRWLPVVIGVVMPSSEVGRKLFAKMKELNGQGVPAYSLAGGLVAVIPDQLDEIATSLNIGLSSNDRNVAEDAAHGLMLWLEAASANGSVVPSPPGVLFRDIGIAVASRRSPSLIGALSAATWTIRLGTENLKGMIAPFLLEGLDCLAQEARYELDGESDLDIPRLRRHCAYLAKAMADEGYAEHTTVQYWLESAAQDPLPEVRDAIASAEYPQYEVGEQDDPQSESD